MTQRDFILPCRVWSSVLQIDAPETVSYEKEQFENGPVVVFVTGEAVGSKTYDISDPIVRRIETNSDLYVSVHDNESIDYVRRSLVDSVVANLGCCVIGVVVCGSMESVDVDAEVAEVRRRRFAVSTLKKDIPLVDYLASRLLKRILLPVLLAYLAVLLANFCFHSTLTDRLGDLHSAYAKESVEAKKRSVVTQAQEKLFAEYEAVHNAEVTLISDNVASVIPDDIRLSSLVLDATRVRLSGEAFTSETVMALVEKLRDSVECKTINVDMLEKDRKEDLFRFEIQILL